MPAPNRNNSNNHHNHNHNNSEMIRYDFAGNRLCLYEKNWSSKKKWDEEMKEILLRIIMGLM